MKKTLAAYCLSLTALALLWSGCDKCPAEEKKTYDYGFSNGTAGIVPYTVGDSFMMVDSFGNTETYAVMSADIIPIEEQCECCPLERRDQLEVSAMKGFQTDALQFKLLQEGTSGVKTGTSMQILIGTSTFAFRIDSSGSVAAVAPTTLTTRSSFPVGSHTYLTVYELQTNVTDSTKANMAWYSTQGGLLRYKKVNGEIWSLP